MQGERLIVVHNHLFKNAGTTIDWALGREFGAGFVDHRADADMRRGAEYLGPFLLANPGIQALSTHHLCLPLPEMPDARIALITMFRHPVERVTSVYEFERRQQDAQTPGAIKARESSCREYVEWRLEPGVGATIRNFHVRKCLPPRRGLPDLPDASELARAIAFTRSTGMLGLVERFDESMLLFEEFLRPHHPGIDLSYVPQNVGQSAAVTGEERVQRLRDEIGGELFARFLGANAPDLHLHAAVVTEFERRLSDLPDAKQRLAEFRLRCERRRQPEG
jgi:hypothetical protein